MTASERVKEDGERAKFNEGEGYMKKLSQYKHINVGMRLDGFKSIFWWEYSHRLWDRIIGAAFLIPFLYFLARGYLRRAWAPRLGLIFLMGVLEGVIGWYMVSSGFEDRDSVSQYRLVLHLGMALLIYALILWSALDLLSPTAASNAHALRGHGWVLIAAIALELVLGGLVAGLHGGLIYNDFPFMNGAWIAPDVFGLTPWWRSAPNPAYLEGESYAKARELAARIKGDANLRRAEALYKSVDIDRSRTA